ncbi:class I adenylate-forming enzyme family protein [Actinophytocola glycyrrhizae]|uniref:Class I adenylate-forming enzyme family protein n=1 Tax=Actinophytocola glycyrrhizae TaxID=2044873 RepID=A0ABV9S4N2_9PSEU
MVRDPLLLHDFLDLAAERTPGRPAVLGPGEVWTYRDLWEASHAFARWLTGRGVGRGDRVVTLLPNHVVMAAVLFGSSRAGAAFTPLAHEMKPFQLRGVLAAADPAVVIAPGALPDGLTATRRTVTLDVLRRELERSAASPVPGAAEPGDTALLLHTSGSTAVPKAVICPHERVVFAARAVATRLGYTGADRIFVRLPLSFDYGLYQLLLACQASASVYLCADGTVNLARELRDSGATVVPVVPLLADMINDLADRRPFPSRVRLFTNTGAALGPAAAAQLRRNFPGAAVVPMFGLTECKRVSVGEPDEDLVRPGSVGRALPGTSITIHDQHDEPLPAGQVGQIVVHGPHVMAGYRDAPELSRLRFRADTLYTGDFGRLDEQGNLYFHGRRDDIVKRRGVRLSTVEVEAAAEDVPGVRSAVAVFSADDESLCVAVTGDVTPDEVHAGLEARLEPGKRPDRCVVLDRMPTNGTGKTDRAAVAQTIGARRGDS